MIRSLYLLHGHPPDGRAPWHYFGSSRDVDQRVGDHLKGRGSKAVRMMQKTGYTFVLARIWRDVPRGLVVETTIKRYRDRLGFATWKTLCPLCVGKAAETLDFNQVLRMRAEATTKKGPRSD